MRALALLAIVMAGAGCDALLRLNEVKLGDARGVDGPRATIAISALNHTRVTSAAEVDLPLSIDDPAVTYLLVTVGVARTGTGGAVPLVLSVNYQGMPLTLVKSVVGVPTDGTTRSEQYELVMPPTGANHVTIMLAGPPYTTHASAVAFVGVDPSSPVRAAVGSSGNSVTSAVEVTSEVGDLVFSVTGQGMMIAAPTGGAHLVFLENSSGLDTLDNAAASTIEGASPTVSVGWQYTMPDNWQTLATSLRPQ